MYYVKNEKVRDPDGFEMNPLDIAHDLNRLQELEKALFRAQRTLLMAHHVLDHGTVGENIIARAEIMALLTGNKP